MDSGRFWLAGLGSKFLSFPLFILIQHYFPTTFASVSNNFPNRSPKFHVTFQNWTEIISNRFVNNKQNGFGSVCIRSDRFSLVNFGMSFFGLGWNEEKVGSVRQKERSEWDGRFERESDRNLRFVLWCLEVVNGAWLRMVLLVPRKKLFQNDKVFDSELFGRNKRRAVWQSRRACLLWIISCC